MEVTNEVYQVELNKYIDQLQTAEMEVKEAEVILAIMSLECLGSAFLDFASRAFMCLMLK